MKLSIVIPVYNEKNTLRKILNRVDSVNLSGVKKEIIIVDDASTDGSEETLRRIAKKRSDIKIHYHLVNQGKGASLRDGFQLTTGDYIIVQDADLEYDPEDYKKLLRALEEEDADVVYGSRFLGTYKDMLDLHYVGNKLLTLVTNLLYGVMLTDMETCYKLMPGNFVRKVKIESSRFNFEPEITAKILKSGLKIVEVPISYKGRSFSEGKKICWKDGVSALITLLRFRFF
jgi:glycosyltransferase involved in cell wall biosynthesis